MNRKMPPSSFYDNLTDQLGLNPAGEVSVPTPEEAALIAAHAKDDPSRLALWLRKVVDQQPSREQASKPALRPSLILRQVQGYQILSRKVPAWASVPGLCLPDPLPLEQCSSEMTASYKAALVDKLTTRDTVGWGEKGVRLVDLTGGLGVDLAFMTAAASAALYVERQPELAALVQHNFRQLGLHQIEVRVGDAEAALSVLRRNAFDLLFLDPARRSKGGGKVAAMADCEPDVTMLLPALFEVAPVVLLKLSPMLDISEALKALPQTSEVHVVAVDNECKELLVWLKRDDEPDDVLMTCVNLRSVGTDDVLSVSRRLALASEPVFQAAPGRFLYEPNAALLKAGLFNYLTTAYPVGKLHLHSHLYTSDCWLPSFPGRGFEVVGWSPYHPKKVKEAWPTLTKANVTCRHFPEGVDQVRKRLKLADGGDDYLFATTLLDGSRVIVRTRKVT